MIAFIIICVIVLPALLGWFIIGPMAEGYPPFTSIKRALEIDKERRNRR